MPSGNPSLVETPRSSDLATFKILMNGNAIPESYHVASIDSVKEANRIPTARVVLLDGDVAKAEFPASDSNLFLPGSEIELLFGYHGEEATIFKGIVTKHSIRSLSNKPGQLILECKDTAFRMTLNRKSAVFQEMSDSDIVSEIANEYGLSPDVETTDTTHLEMVQFQATDWDFVLSRMEANGKIVFVDDGTLVAKTPPVSGDATLALGFGSAIIEFEAEIEARHQRPEISSHAWAPADQAPLDADAAEPSLPSQGNIEASQFASDLETESSALQHTGLLSDTELQSWADSRLAKGRLAKIRGRVRCQGFAEIKPGDLLDLAGIGERFNGLAPVAAVRQELYKNHWETDIQFGYDPEWFAEKRNIEALPAGGLLPGIRGLHIGVVKQLEGDPDGEDRILVNIPLMDSEAEGLWARQLHPDAGDSRTVLWRPEIEDEVVVGFLNDDPRHAVIIGSLHSSAKPAPIEAADDNHLKGIVTRGNMRLILVVLTNIVTLSTPAGNILELSEDTTGIKLEDQNGNKIVLDPDGIVLESTADIKITASGDITSEGTNIKSAAQAEYKSEGSASAEISSGGNTSIKGSQVMIN